MKFHAFPLKCALRKLTIVTLASFHISEHQKKRLWHWNSWLKTKGPASSSPLVPEHIVYCGSPLPKCLSHSRRLPFERSYPALVINFPLLNLNLPLKITAKAMKQRGELAVRQPKSHFPKKLNNCNCHQVLKMHLQMMSGCDRTVSSALWWIL